MNRSMSQKPGARFTEKQGHYLAFIYTYSHMFGRPPAESCIPRSIEILVPPENLPILSWPVSNHQNHCDEPLASFALTSWQEVNRMRVARITSSRKNTEFQSTPKGCLEDRRERLIRALASPSRHGAGQRFSIRANGRPQRPRLNQLR
ncbi:MULTISPECIES: hypothetical protein [unclassified Bradyrhizobium]|uniref:hypothetical protein n=1 Tax=unclassified Bradyrhizobium TaxID=2631580 RepID=UPI001CD1FC8A|nr:MULTISPECIES: hypothetical protein [unclassified Bradyrhizobium]